MGDKYSLYQKIRSFVGELHNDLSAKNLDLKSSNLWKDVKGDETAYSALVVSLTAKVKSLESKRLNVWANFSKPKERNETDRLIAVVDHTCVPAVSADGGCCEYPN